MVKLSALPGFRRVAGLAFGRKIGLAMVRVRGVFEIGCVTTHAGLRCSGEPSAHVTGGASCLGMGPGESELGESAVIELRSRPGRGCVTRGALLWESSCDMVGVRGSRKVSGVATQTICLGRLEPAPDVAGHARLPAMSAGQWELRKAVMIEAGHLPVIHAVAGFAGNGEIRFLMIDGHRLLVLRQMARRALSAESGIDCRGRATMAGIADCGRMRSQERETTLVILHRPRGDLPTAHGMAILALGPELAAMQIGVAISAPLAGLGEHLGDMAQSALDVVVHAAQGKLGFPVVIEFQLSPQRRPAGGGVAVLAGKRYGTVRIPRRLSVNLPERGERQEPLSSQSNPQCPACCQTAYFLCVQTDHHNS